MDTICGKDAARSADAGGRKIGCNENMDAEKLALAAKILKDAGGEEVYLFGSQATGDAHENSDVDLGVKGLAPSKFFGMHWRLEDALNMPVDLVDFDVQSDFYELLNRIGER